MTIILILPINIIKCNLMLILLVVICILLSSLVIHELCNYQSFVDLLHCRLELIGIFIPISANEKLFGPRLKHISSSQEDG